MTKYNMLSQNYKNVLNRIKLAETNNQRTSKVSLLAVSKTKPIENILQLVELGQIDFGENYLQESLPKIDKAPHLIWHYIGQIQSNKTRDIAQNFSWVHSVDRLKIAQRLNQQRPSNLPPLNILLNINIDNEANKAGYLDNEIFNDINKILELPNINLRGLMAIPKKTDDVKLQRLAFSKVNRLLKEIQKEFKLTQFNEASMGMSNDLDSAIAEGATIVRIGTDIFGAR